ncbi:actin-associated protein FAM107A isoform X2 [Dicentrarchus labrax]|uniref:actin-associated protein FAM107A isoform X2 n=1 Tax=Dicentrarchus labrax TaxID=13489 RepID=UPI0021F524D0|nr:actin-associated protein FAM107A isoform X2 [Dicentrarchus labrax]
MDQSPEQSTTPREGMVKSASAYADLQQHRSEGIHRRLSPVSNYVPQPDYLEGEEDEDLIKPKKLVNPVKASKSHQELHRELMSSCKRGHGVSVEMKPELQRVLESRKRDQLIKQRKQEEEAHRKISPLEAELLKRHRKLEEVQQPGLTTAFCMKLYNGPPSPSEGNSIYFIFLTFLFKFHSKSCTESYSSYLLFHTQGNSYGTTKETETIMTKKNIK